MNRRDFIARLSLGAGLSLLPAEWLRAERTLFSSRTGSGVPVRALTKGPGYHWFGYYDKFQFDETDRYVLSMRANFENRPITPDDKVTVGMIDLKKGDRWIELGESNAFSWQQGCMLQWIPGRKHEVIWNTREGDRFVSVVLNVKNRRRRVLPRPVYALSPDGKWAITTDFERIQSLRPGYGYAGVEDRSLSERAPRDRGIYRMDLETGRSEMLFSLYDIASIPCKGESLLENFHWFNHLLVNTDGTRINFLNRWRTHLADTQSMAVGGFATRMFTCNPDGSDLYCLDDSGHLSHFVWRDPTHICIYSEPEGKPWNFYVYEDKTRRIEKLGGPRMPGNDGHQTYFYNDRDWVVADNYAWDEYRNQTPYLYQISSDRHIPLHDFYLPKAYTGEWRCDLHPRISRNGNMLCVDGVDENGRQLYLLDLSGVRK